MQVVVNKPHIKFNISVDGTVTTVFLNKIADLVRKEYGSAEVTYDENEELIDCFESEWFKETQSSMTPGDYLKIYRENHNFTQTELGEKLGGLSRQVISDLENGRRGISKELAKKLASFFDVPVERFL